MKDRYEILGSLTPVNKSAAVVTSQAGCDGEILIKEDKEKLKALSAQKRHYSDKVCNLKEEMKIRPNWDRRSLPRYILDHPKYLKFVQLRSKLTELDVEINKLNKKVKSKKGGNSFYVDFVTMVKEKYPHIFEEVKALIK